MSKPSRQLPPEEDENEAAPSSKGKTGRMSTDDHAFIRENAGKLSSEEIARQLGRRKEAVERVLRDLARKGVRRVAPSLAALDDEVGAKEEVRAIKAELKDTEAWRRIRQEFTDDEIRFFEAQYTALMTQFKNNVLASEVIQIFDLCKFEVLKSRNLSLRKQLRQEIDDLEEERASAQGGVGYSELEPEARKTVNAIRNQIAEARRNEREYTTEFSLLQQRSEALMKSLKSTRDQRIKEFESDTDTILGLIKKLQNSEFQAVEARRMELMRMAAEKEMLRLGQPHEYEDGSWDRPILSADTVNMETKE